ncbi:MAG: NAD-dependent epimerase/dehydratase family protein [Gammaproteobacteria bacterium]|nr:NAD-dependent epimerase/dehydratase family protein [Gammaproteobacteria bacterium]
MMPVSIVGCGYTGLRLARRLRAEGIAVRGYATRPQSLEAVAATGAEACALDLDREAASSLDVEGRIVQYMVPPAPTGTRDLRLERFLGALAGRPQRLVYLGTTGVYGDRGGAPVDEDTPPQPRTARAARRLAAENSVRAWAAARAASWCILRVAGIYGPERLRLDRLRRAEPAIAPAEATPTNRIHVDDLVEACIVAGRSARAAERIVNVADGNDDSQTAFLMRVARITGLSPPPLISRAEAERTSSAAAWSFLAESRRVGNRRLVEELGVQLRYRDLDQGIRASLAEG